MDRSALIAVVLAALMAVSLTSCTRPAEEFTEVAEPPADITAEPAPGPAEEEVAPAEPAAEMSAEAVVEQVGAPVFEGATEVSVETEEGVTKATYTTTAAYKDVKAYYMGELKEPDWTNNGFEMGAMGGDEWEFKSADGTKLVLVKSDSSSGPTEIRFTVKPASE